MKKKIGLLALFTLALGLASLQAATNDVYELSPLVVWGNREAAWVSGIQDAPWREQLFQLSVREQGVGGTLTDLSVNGSSFSEAGMLLNGLAIRNAQTEHFNSDVMLPFAWLTKSEVLTGLDLFRVSSAHPAGSLAVEMAPFPAAGGQLTVGAGLDGLYFGRAHALETAAVGETGSVWAGAFAEGAHADKIDGYDANKMDRYQAGGRLGVGAADWSVDSFFSYMNRDFGAQGAYGANEKYPAREKDEVSLFSTVGRFGEDEETQLKLAFMWMQARDTYILKRENPDFYENTHQADSFTLGAVKRSLFGECLFVDWRGDFDAQLYSTRHHNNYTGRNPKTKEESFKRFHGSFAALPGARLGDWELAVGAAGEFFSGGEARCAPAAGISYDVTDEEKVSLSYREGVKMPSFTELTYDSPDSKGTIDLPLQTTRTLALDWTHRARSPRATLPSARGGLFLMRSHHLVDWLKADRASSWKATALEPVTSFGLSGEASLRATDALSLVPRLAVTLKETKSPYWSSRYALDYPLASGSVEMTYRILSNWTLSYLQGIEVWEENPVRRTSNVRNLSRLSTTASWERYACTLSLLNLFDDDFEVYPGERAHGFMAHLAFTVSW